MAQYVSDELIIADVLLENQGKKLTVRAMIDTGAQSFMFIEPAMATSLGLVRGEPVPFQGVGGQIQMGFMAKMGRGTILDNPDCSLSNFDVTVSKLGLHGFDILVGKKFLAAAKSTIDLSEEDIVLISCKKGPKAVIESKSYGETALLVGGAAIMMVGLLGLAWVLLRRD